MIKEKVINNPVGQSGQVEIKINEDLLLLFRELILGTIKTLNPPAGQAPNLISSHPWGRLSW